jgi:hypothetical protein
MPPWLHPIRSLRSYATNIALSRHVYLQAMSSKSARDRARILVLKAMTGIHKTLWPFVVAIEAEILIVRL